MSQVSANLHGHSSITPRTSTSSGATQWTRSALAAFIGGTLEGQDGPVARIADPEEAQANDVVAARHQKYLEPCLQSGAGLIMLPADAKLPELPGLPNRLNPPALLRVTDTELAWERLLSAFAPVLERSPEIDSSASVHPSAVIGANVHIAAHVTVAKDARIGAGSIIMAGSFIGEGSSLGMDCQVHPNVTIQHHVHLGDRVLVQAGAVIGADGFGFRRTSEHQHVRLPHIGTVIIEDDVEIGANSVIDRATIGETRVGARSKLGASCIVAHNSMLGQDVLLIGAVQMGGSTILEDRVTLLGQVGVAGHLRIGANSTVAAQSGVSKSLPANGTFRGSPARPANEFARTEARVRDLERLRERVQTLETTNQVSNPPTDPSSSDPSSTSGPSKLEALMARVLELERKLEGQLQPESGTQPLKEAPQGQQ